jgi:hypothetical protein
MDSTSFIRQELYFLINSGTHRHTRIYTYIYCDVLPGNASNNLWVLDLLLRFIGYTPGGITINDNTLNGTVLPCAYNLVITLKSSQADLLIFYYRYYPLLTNSVNHSLRFTCLELAVCRCIPIL